MDKAFVVKRVAEKLWATEDAIDSAIVQASGMVSSLVEARQELKVSAVVGDEVMTKMTDALKALADARHAAVEAHNALAETKLRLGIRTKMDLPVKGVLSSDDESADRRRAI